MKRRDFQILIMIVYGVLIAVLFAFGPARAQREPSVDPKIAARAKEWFFRFQGGDIDRSQLDASSNSMLTDRRVAQEKRHLQWFGSPSSFRFVGSEPVMGATSYDFVIDVPKGRIIERIALLPNGTIAGLDFQTFVRREITDDPPPAPDQTP